MNMHMIYDFFSSSVKVFTTHYFNIFKGIGVEWTAENFNTLFTCCGKAKMGQHAIESVEGMMVSHEARVNLE
jgi:hypothetical protein